MAKKKFVGNMQKVFDYLSRNRYDDSITFRNVAIGCAIAERTAREQIRKLRFAGFVMEGPRTNTLGGRSARTWQIGKDVEFLKSERRKAKDAAPDSVSEQLLAENSDLKKENRKLLKKVEKLEQEKAQLGVASLGGAKVDERPRQLSFGGR